jgi:Flp pilus assembly protein TadB
MILIIGGVVAMAIVGLMISLALSRAAADSEKEHERIFKAYQDKQRKEIGIK